MLPTAAQLKKIFPNAKPAIMQALLNNLNALDGAKINTQKRLMGFLASIGVETGGLRATEENLNYSAKRLLQVFPKYYKTQAQANADAGKPQRIANRVYGGRLGNKPSPSNDGWDFRGGGAMQTTGRDNYRALGFENNPEALREPNTAIITAVREWTKRKGNALADKGDWAGVRKAINGGLNGYDEFMRYVVNAGRALPAGGGAQGSVVEVVDPVQPPEPQPAPQPAPEPPVVVVPVPVPEPVPAALTDEATIRSVQDKLLSLGYTEVGGVDGKMGKMTKTAILAFRNEHDLPLRDTIDADLLAAMDGANKRALAPERASANIARVTSVVPEANNSWWAQMTGWASAGVAGVGYTIKETADSLGPAKDTVRPIMDLMNDIPGWIWVAAIVAISASSAVLARRAVANSKAAFQDGSRR